MTSTVLPEADEFFLSMAVFSAFVDRGIRSALTSNMSAAIRGRDQVLLEKAASLMPLAIQIERSILAQGLPPPACRGTVEADVCAPFGAWYVEHCDGDVAAVDLPACRNRLANGIVDFFAKGQTPMHAWSVVRAAKAVEPALALPRTTVRNSINWEWAQRLRLTEHTISGGEHTLYPRSRWMDEDGPHHISDYWAWVEYRIQANHVLARYAELRAAPCIFRDILEAYEVRVDGETLDGQDLRRDLIAQECIETVPACTAFSTGLLEALPHLRKAFTALCTSFDLETWIARPVADFMTEYVRAASPDDTAVVSGTLAKPNERNRFSVTLRTLWLAVPDAAGSWQLPDGSRLSFVQSSVNDSECDDMAFA